MQYSSYFILFFKKFWIQNCIWLSLPSEIKRRVGQGVKTPPFHGGITGSIPVRATKIKPRYYRGFFISFSYWFTDSFFSKSKMGNILHKFFSYHDNISLASVKPWLNPG